MSSISVVIPTCDRLEFLKETIECIVSQSRPADEIIVVNNGKSPLPRGYLTENIKVLELPPYVGVSRARNEGVAVASGDYIAFQDDDDLWEKDYLKKVEALIKQENPDCIITRKDKVVNNKIITYKNADGQLKLPILFRANPGIGGPTTVMRKATFIGIGGYDTSLRTSEDKSLIIDLLLKEYHVIAGSHIQAIVRDHNLSRLTDSANMEEGITAFIKKYDEHMSFAQKNYNWLKVYRHRYKRRGDWLTFFKYKARQFLDRLFHMLNRLTPMSH